MSSASTLEEDSPLTHPAEMVLDVRILPAPAFCEQEEPSGTRAEGGSVGGQPVYRDLMTRPGSAMNVGVARFPAGGEAYGTGDHPDPERG
jgi:hypothetical protein